MDRLKNVRNFRIYISTLDVNNSNNSNVRMARLTPFNNNTVKARGERCTRTSIGVCKERAADDSPASFRVGSKSIHVDTPPRVVPHYIFGARPVNTFWV